MGASIIKEPSLFRSGGGGPRYYSLRGVCVCVWGGGGGGGGGGEGLTPIIMLYPYLIPLTCAGKVLLSISSVISHDTGTQS